MEIVLRCMRALFSMALVLGTSRPSMAQFYGPLQPSVQWEAGRLVMAGREGGSEILILDKGFKVFKTIPYPKGVSAFPGSRAFVRGGTAWVFSHEEGTFPEGELAIDRIYGCQNEQWTVLGVHSEKAERCGFNAIIPLDDGRFFGIRRAQLSTSRGLEGPFYLLEADAEGRLRQVREAEAGVSPKLLQFDGMPRAYQVILVEEYFMLIDSHPGWIWVYALKDGALKRVIRVYEEIDEKRIEKNDFSTVVIGAQPLEDGRVLVVVRPRASALADDFARRMAASLDIGVPVPPESNAPSDVDRSLGARELELMDWAWKHNPEVCWMSLEPASGVLKALVPPPTGARDRILSMLECATFRWIPGWGDRVEFRSLEQLLAEGEERAAAAKRPAEGAKKAGGVKANPGRTDASGSSALRAPKALH